MRIGAFMPIATALAAGGCPSPEPLVADAGADVVAFAGDEVAFDGSASRGARTWAWTFGDGAALPPAGEPVAVHAFDAAGHFTATLTVGDGRGRTAVASIAVTIAWPPAAVAPAAASAIAATPPGAPEDALFVAVPDFDLVARVDRAARAVAAHLDTCDEPRSVAVSPGGAFLAVACRGSDEIDLIALQPGAASARLALPRGSRPRHVAFAPDADDAAPRAFATLQGTGEVAEIAFAPADPSAATIRRVAALPDAYGLAATADAVIVTRFRSPDDAGAWALLPRPDLVPAQTFDLAFDDGPDSDTAARGVPNYLHAAVPSPDGRVVVFPSLQSNVARGLFRDGLPLTFETTARPVLSAAALDAVAGPLGEELLGRKHFNDRDMATAAAFSPLGDWLFVATWGAQAVQVLDAYTFETVASFTRVGEGLDALHVTPDGAELWVVAALSRELVAYDLAGGPGAGAAGELARLDLRPGGAEVLAPDVHLGKRIFSMAADPRMSRRSYLSCASCHFDGDSDGRTWDFTDRGEGLRNTASLAGGAGVSPLHWSANFDEVQDFENDIRGPMEGTGFMEDADWAATMDTLGAPKAGRSADLDALAAYLATLAAPPRSPFRAPDGSLTPDALAGEALFEDPAIGCATCHSAATAFTDSAWLAPATPLLHDVGTLGPGSGARLGGPLTGLDTPSLRGAWATAPYLHDGSAATLREVLVDRNPLDLHGVTSGLGAAEIDALVAYVLQIE